jgi:hypothetical protein
MLLQFATQLDDCMAQCSLSLESLNDVVCLALDVLVINWMPDFAHCLIIQTVSCG